MYRADHAELKAHGSGKVTWILVNRVAIISLWMNNLPFAFDHSFLPASSPLPAPTEIKAGRVWLSITSEMFQRRTTVDH